MKNTKRTSSKIFNKNNKIIFLLLFPLVFNFLINLFTEDIIFDNLLFNLYKVTSSFLYFLFYLYLGNLIKKSLDLETVSVGITLYLFSFFIIDNTFLFLTRFITFKFLHFLISIFWIIFIMYRLKILKQIYILLLIKTVLIIFQYLFLEYNPEYIATSGDVENMWYPWVEKINNNNLFFLMQTNSREGAGLLVSHIQAVIFTDAFPFLKYRVFTPSFNLFFFFGNLFFFETKFHKTIKYSLLIVFTILVLNSEWLNYLFVNSLMAEAVVSLFFAITFKNYLNHRDFKKNRINFVISALLLGHLFHSKFFINLIALIVIIVAGYYKKNFKDVIILFIILLVNELNYRYMLPNVSKNELLSQVKYDEIFTSTFEYSNVVKIFKHISTDKPFVYITLVAIFLFILNIKNKNCSIFSFATFLIILVNLISILFLYIAIWKEVEFESAYRYVLNLFHLQILWFGINLNDYTSKEKTSLPI